VGEVWLEQGPIDEHASQHFQPPAVAPVVGSEIDEGGVAKLSGGWAVHVPSRPWIKSSAAGRGGCRTRKPSAFPAVDFVELKFMPLRG